MVVLQLPQLGGGESAVPATFRLTDPHTAVALLVLGDTARVADAEGLTHLCPLFALSRRESNMGYTHFYNKPKTIFVNS